MRVLIVGCGYIGIPLGTELVKRGHEVLGMRRSSVADAAMLRGGIQPFHGDTTSDADLTRLPGTFDWVVSTVSSGRGGLEEYRATYLTGARCLLQWLEQRPPKKFVYTSSTGVYGQDDGSLVKESSLTEPLSPTAQVLVEAERLMFESFRTHGLPIVIFRLAGIYGPDRTYFLRQFLSDELRLADQGSRIMNMVHRDDVVRAIITGLEHGRPGEAYNVVDDEPVSQVHFFRWLADALGRPMPRSWADQGKKDRKRGPTNKRVCNRKLKMELGFSFRFPTYREGYTAELARLESQSNRPN
jgi:nucleoside-diphosphate-sugar epimerase